MVHDDKLPQMLLRPAGKFFNQHDWLSAAATFVISLAVYTYTLAPTVTLEYSGELVVAADYLGVPHPPGYPLWTILAWIFHWIFHWARYLGQPNPAWGVNFMSGFFGALCTATIALLVSRSGLTLLRTCRKQEDEGQTSRMDAIICWASGVSAGLLVAFCPFLWSQCVITEVYSLNAFLHLLILALLYVWMHRPKCGALLYGMALAFGLAVTDCYPIALLMPALILVILATDPKLFRDFACAGLFVLAGIIFYKTMAPEWGGSEPPPWKPVTLAVACVFLVVPVFIWLVTRQVFTEWRRVLLMTLYAALGLSLFIYLPIASDTNPPLNWGYPRTMEGFRHAFTRGQYAALNPAVNPVEAAEQSLKFFQEFEKQFPIPLRFLALLPVLFFHRIWRRHWGWLAGLILAFLFTGPGLMIIVNLPHDLHSLFIVRPHFAPSTAIYGIWAGYGFLLALAFLDRILRVKAVVYAGIAIALLCPLSLIWRNEFNREMTAENSAVNMRGHDFGWQFGNYLLRGVNAIREEIQQQQQALPFGDAFNSVKPILNQLDPAGTNLPPNPNFPPEMTTNAVFFGGTDPGRFVPTYMIYSGRVREDVYLITQNALADNTYMNVMRDLYGDRIWMPSAFESNEAFRKYIDDVRAGRLPQSAAITFDKNGRVSVQGVQGVMEINGIICKMIFEANKSKHDFYVEESYVIAWMYPYLSPHGLIMKINKEPLPQLTPAMIKDDMDFWNWYGNRLMNNPHFLSDVVARKSFSKLRCAIAGLYAYRRLFNEAEAAFRQAVNLFPTSPEANFRLADLYLQNGRFQDAIQVMEKNFALDRKNDRIEGFIKQIKEVEKTNARIQELQNSLSKGGSLEMIFELMTLYKQTGREPQFDGLARQVLGNTNLPPQACQKVAELALVGQPHFQLAADAYLNYLKREPADPRAWVELAFAQLAMGQADPSLQSLIRAVSLGGEAVKEALRNDKRFDPIRNAPPFQRLVTPEQLPMIPGLGGIIP
jgi:tetratricopeptide (TPR) repeat protein